MRKPWTIKWGVGTTKNCACSCSSDDYNDILENELDTDDDDAEIENDTTLEQNINNDDATDDGLIVTNNEKNNITNNSRLTTNIKMI